MPKPDSTPRYPTAKVAADLNRTPDNIRFWAEKYDLGTLVTPRLRMWSDADVARLIELLAQPVTRAKRRRTEE